MSFNSNQNDYANDISQRWFKQDSSNETIGDFPTLKVIQEPSKARCCGHGSTDFRTIDPPPIVTLESTSKSINHRCSDNDWMVTVSLWSLDKDQKPLCEDDCNLIGNRIAESRSLEAPDGKIKTFFIFPNLYIRKEGLYRLWFRLIRISSPNRHNLLPSTVILDSVYSDTLTVYSPKHFPGKSKPSVMMRMFAKQTHDLKARNL
ncbi:velvet factor [Globomyces pollinis-pini]|nr:velvet factor [Globomyces pollinis-pini]